MLPDRRLGSDGGVRARQHLNDLRRRLGGIVVASTYEGKSVTADDLKVAGAMTVLEAGRIIAAAFSRD